jgi:xanthine dehydrogenase YagS FAD-binding subunit
MRPFTYERAETPARALELFRHEALGTAGEQPQFLAGGTLLVDLMKLGTVRPATLVDINGLAAHYGAITNGPEGLELGALVSMAQAAAHEDVMGEYPVLAQSLLLAASAQLRNMATLGGNVLQRTRCSYFRDPSYRSCNKLEPGSGCAALEGNNRMHAVLGVSEHCIASYPGDFAQALVALDASVDVLGPAGVRTLRVSDLHRPPGDTPHLETVLEPGELLTRFRIPKGPWTRRSLYLKLRDRESYEFAVASAAVALHLTDGIVQTARVALGGVATRPWRAYAAEDTLRGRRLDEKSAEDAAEDAFAGAVTHGDNDLKPEIGRRTLARALLEAARMEI